ncbi:hypothetical protein B0T21DRAFT_412942 [Apiosordaria backusii]|uniref:Uncharacterized protein n=1 Tax=Apiosordaria backusii TaxID=314023 RepID=A0AA40ECW4_9PEZI|nr:hypothetical protein B0T21DRAFT_412942 [Apiosordaria backusii]
MAEDDELSAGVEDDANSKEELWENYFVPFPEYRHETAMLRAFAIRKGEYKTGCGDGSSYTHNKPTQHISSSSCSAGSKADTISDKLSTEAEGKEEGEPVTLVTLNASRTHVDPASLVDGYKKFALPFYDVGSRSYPPSDNCFARRLALTLDEVNSPRTLWRIMPV